MIEWYVARGGKKEGPYSDSQFRQLVEESSISPTDLVWYTGSQSWTPACEVRGLLAPPLLPADQSSSPSSPLSQPLSISRAEVVQSATRTSRDSQAVSVRMASYFKRHWFGDLSLGVSYWVNGVLFTTAVSILVAITTTAFQPLTHLVLMWSYTVGIWTALLLLTVWQQVGIWRSAGKHQSRGGRAFWAGAVKFMVVIAVLNSALVFITKGFLQINELTKLTFGEDPFGKYQIHLLRDGTELEVSGPLTFGLTNDVRTILDASSQVKVIHLKSIGGRLAEARNLRDLIRERSLITYTATGCNSACTIAFLGGQKRLIAAEARLGFHQYAFPGMDQADIQAAYVEDRQSMLAAGVSPAFADRAFSTPNAEMWYPTPQELLQAGVITGFASKADFALSGVAAFRDRTEIEHLLARIPVYEAIRQFDPDTYEKIITDMERYAREGRTEAKLISELRQHISSLARKYMPVAADEPLLEMTRVIIRQLETLGAKGPDLCYRFLFPQAGNPLDLSELLPKELQEAELRVIAELIATGASHPQHIPTEKQVSRSLERVIASLSRTHGDDVNLLADLTSPGIDKQKVCEIIISMYREVLKLPNPTNVRVLRYVFASK